MSKEIAVLKGISKEYSFGKEGHFLAVNNISLTLTRGSIYCLVGPSGSGKTTLLNILGLLDLPTHGEYLFDGNNVIGITEHRMTELRASMISFMFQENYLIPYFTSLENLLLPVLQLRRIQKSDRERAAHLLEQVGLADQMNKRVSNLSGGQRQRVCIARALLKSPALLLADEPSASLDSKTTEGILRLFEEIRDNHNTAIIVSTHDKTVMDHFQTNLIKIHDGVLV